jgi:hypothetical protein
MTLFERAEIRTGRLKLSGYVNHRKPKPISDAEFVALVEERRERAWTVLERITAPNCDCDCDRDCDLRKE